MDKRKIIEIEPEKCNGCGLCIPNCPEGAIQLIDGKAILINDIFCDGLGACLGHCPEGAITVKERTASPYSEKKVMQNIVRHGKNTILAHLEHLDKHNEEGYLNEALIFLKENNIEIDYESKNPSDIHHGCPGVSIIDFQDRAEEYDNSSQGKRRSELKQWPIQLHLVSPNVSYYKNKDLVLTADCVGYALGDFHKDYLKGKSIAIACPKLDINQEIYINKITSMIDDANINTITVMVMEVPCCGGLYRLVEEALSNTKRKVPIKLIVASVHGEILSEEWK